MWIFSFVIVFMVLNILYTKSNHYQCIMKQFLKFRHVPCDLDIVNIGSGSSLYGFDWNCVDDAKGYSFALAPQDFRYDARMLEEYAHYVKEGGVVVVVACPLSFGKNIYLERNTFSDKYSSVLPKRNVDLPLWRYCLNRYFPFIRYGKNFIRTMLCKNSSAMVDESMNAKADKIVMSWINDNPGIRDLNDASSFFQYTNIFLQRKKELRNIIEICYEFKLRPIIVIPPLSHYVCSNISEQFMCKFYLDNIRAVCQKEVILNYLNNNVLSNDELYENGVFLNSEGSKIFTNLVWEDIKKC